MDLGNKVIVGIDEVGRGPLAGPMVIGAVIMGDAPRIRGVKDSKQLDAITRYRLSQKIRRRARAVGLGWAVHSEIDEFGLTKAWILAAHRALVELNHPFDHALIDGKFNPLKDHYESTAIIGGDNLVYEIAAASIVAKVARDQYMAREMHRLYPKYGFRRHKGYATKKHIAAIKKYGVCDIHRHSFVHMTGQNFYLNLDDIFEN